MRAAVLIAFVVGMASIASAESVIPGVLTVPESQCVWRAGDNPAWATPNLDESGWRPYSEWKPSTLEPRFWVRCHTSLTSLSTIEHTVVQVRLSAAYQLYFNGVPIASSGDLRSGNFSMNAISNDPIPSSLLSSGSSATICLRLTNRDLVVVPSQIIDSLETRLQLSAGDETLLDSIRAQIVLARESRLMAITVCYGVIGVIALMLLSLFLYDRTRYELLLLSLDCLFLAIARINEFGAASMLNFSFAACQAIQLCCTIGFTITQLYFVFALARRRVPVVFQILMAITILIMSSFALNVLMGSAQPKWAESLSYTLLRTSMLAGEMAISTGSFFAFWPYTRVTSRMRTLAGLCMFWGLTNIAYYGVLMPFSGAENLSSHWIGIVLEFRAFTVAGLLIAILAILFREQQKTAQDRAVLAGEMQAAREIQSLLAPATLKTIPGVSVGVAFHPMREVGGDFFSSRILSNNRQRILLGDVSGKGTAAAMAAALLLGGAADHDDATPARLLEHLHRVFRESSVPGFATCICADISPDGGVSIANAGHLAPYRGGQEVSVPAALPLGVSSLGEIAYEETSFKLQHGETLTFISDGVVEAQSSTGELFGFDRTRAISTLVASEIAHRAQSFGQEDDITVLTLSFTTLGVVHA